jgi:ubiquinol-cytochrome c reductase cytochrome c1 subunit
MKKRFASLLAGLAACFALAAPLAQANTGGIHWDKFPEEKLHDTAALQRGAKVFVNYCLNCHAASYMRYNRMQDIGLTIEQIKTSLMFATDKVGDTMKVSLDPRQAKDWFGATPPDLTVIARSRAGEGGSGADYLYTYLRTYYRDETKATGWNNLAFPSVGMPHVLWELQGERRAVYEEHADAHDASKVSHVFKGFEQIKPGQLNAAEYDSTVGDLVAYLQWMGEPAQGYRVKLGAWVLLFLSIFTLFAWRLNASYWKDVK